MTRERLKTDGASLTVWLDGPEWDGRPAATIGEVKITEATAGAALFAQALMLIRDSGLDRVLGPMAGNTWHSYRLVSESDGTPPFMMEPPQDALAAAAFAEAGFTPVARYFSARLPLDKVAHTPPPQTTAFRIETWDGTDPDALFREVYALSVTAFAGNAFYTPVTEAAFLDLYRPMVPLMKPELILFARRPDGSLAGYLFAVPDYSAGPETKTAILKTYASLEPGAGRHLVHACNSAARDQGYHTIIHALIHDDNRSAERSRMERAMIFRRYDLLGLQWDV